MRRTVNASVTFEIGDTEYEVTVGYFSPPSPGTRDDPPDDGETSAADVVTVLKGGQPHDFVTYYTFIRDLAIETKTDEDTAADIVAERLHEAACEKFFEAFDEGPEYEYDIPDAPEYDA